MSAFLVIYKTPKPPYSTEYRCEVALIVYCHADSVVVSGYFPGLLKQEALR